MSAYFTFNCFNTYTLYHLTVNAARKAIRIHPKCQQRKDSNWIEKWPKQFVHRIRQQKKVKRHISRWQTSGQNEAIILTDAEHNTLYSLELRSSM